MDERTIKFVTDKVTLFPDTNYFYDYVNLDQIKWDEELKARQVLIVLTPVVIRELNSHKDGGTRPARSDRAATTIRNLNRFLESANSDEKAVLRPGVELLFEHQDPLIQSPRNPAVADDQLVENVLLYRQENPETRVLLMTSDVGLKIKARAYDVETFTPQEKYKPPPSEDPRDRKIKVLEAQIEQYKNVQPNIEAFLVDKNGLPAQEIVVNSNALENEYEVDDFGYDIGLLGGRYRTVKIPRFTVHLKFRVKNSGNNVAEGVNVFIKLPSDSRIYERERNRFPFTQQISFTTNADTENGTIDLSCRALTHRLAFDSDEVEITFPLTQKPYVLTWTAHANNMTASNEGKLMVTIR